MDYRSSVTALEGWESVFVSSLASWSEVVCSVDRRDVASFEGYVAREDADESKLPR